MATPNPFIQRNLPLSELIARQQRYSGEGQGWIQQLRLRDTNEAIDAYGRRQQPQPRPMQPQPRPMQPQPRPMQPRPQPMAPPPMPAPVSYTPGVMGAPGGGGMAGQVSVTGGGVSPPLQPQGPWAGMGMGLPPVTSSTPYGGYQNFGGFSQQQPYRSGMFR